MDPAISPRRGPSLRAGRALRARGRVRGPDRLDPGLSPVNSEWRVASGERTVALARAGRGTLARTSLYQTNFSPDLNGRVVEKSREFWNSGNHKCPQDTQPEPHRTAEGASHFLALARTTQGSRTAHYVH